MQKREILFVCTPYYSGTHYLMYLLQSHPNISHWVLSEIKIAGNKTVEDYYRDYCASRISFTEMEEIILAVPLNSAKIIAESKSAIAFFERNIGVEFRTKKSEDIKYILCHAHGSNLGVPKEFPCKIITSMRNPVLSFITAMNRNRNGNIVIDGIQFCRNMNNVHRVSIDLPNHVSYYLELFDYLNLQLTQEILDLILLHPLAAPTSQAVANSLIGDAKRKEVEIIANKLFNEKIVISENLWNWICRLQEFNLEEYYKNFGYENLIWFKDNKLEYDKFYN